MIKMGGIALKKTIIVDFRLFAGAVLRGGDAVFNGRQDGYIFSQGAH